MRTDFSSQISHTHMHTHTHTHTGRNSYVKTSSCTHEWSIHQPIKEH